jgi:hypothetical protein
MPYPIKNLFDKKGNPLYTPMASFIKNCFEDLHRYGIPLLTYNDFMDFIHDNFPNFVKLTEAELPHLVRLGIIDVVIENDEVFLFLPK